MECFSILLCLTLSQKKIFLSQNKDKKAFLDCFKNSYYVSKFKTQKLHSETSERKIYSTKGVRGSSNSPS